MPFHTHRLPNGLQIVGETIPTARSVAVGFFVKAGSRDETPAEGGVSHYLEHMAFKGTPRRTSAEVNQHLDRIGASANASTSEETTNYYAAVLPEYLPQAIDVLADILRPSLRQADFDTEKDVILEEISRSDDSPISVAYEYGREIFFAGHPLGTRILGTADSIAPLTRDQMQAYFDRRYAAANILVSLAGQFDWDEAVRLIEAACGHWTGGPVGRSQVVEVAGAGGTHVKVNEKLNQEHVLVMSAGPSVDSPHRYAAAVLSLVIGDDSGSRFHWALDDPGLVEQVFHMVDRNEGCGLTLSLFSCEPDAAAENLGIVRGILSDIQRDNVTAEELATAKTKIASRLVRHAERPSGRMEAVAAAWLYTGEYHDLDRELARFDAVTLADVRACLDRYPLDAPTVVAYGPLAGIE